MNERVPSPFLANFFTYSEPIELRDALQTIGSLRSNRARLTRVIHCAIDPYGDDRATFEEAERD